MLGTRRPGRLRPDARRGTVAALLALLCTAALWWACGGAAEPVDDAGALPPDAPEGASAALPERFFSTQLHVHGSFSEGLGSIESQSREATDVGLDVLWWSDHDWRLAIYHTLSRFSFEPGVVEQDRHGSWVLTDARFEPRFEPRLEANRRRSKAVGEVKHTDERAFDGEWSYRVRASARADGLRPGEGFQPFLAALEAPMPGYRRSLAAGLRVGAALWIEGAGPDGEVWLELRLSEHPVLATASGAGGVSADYGTGEALGDPDFPRPALRYVLGGERAAPARSGEVYWVPLPHREGEWNRLSIDPLEDVARGFPELEAEDNSLVVIHLGIGVRNGRTLTAFLDDLRIEQAERGPAMYARQREVIERVAPEYPALVQLQGVEVSYLHPHLNEFSLGTELFDYDRLAEASGLLNERREVSQADLRTPLSRAVVEAAHARGGLVSFNHFLGTDPDGSKPERPREDVLAEMLEHRLFGADLLEVGYRDRGGHPIRDHLWVWDQLALEGGVRPVGIGVSDHHGGPDRWRAMPNNFVTWIPAGAPTKAELIEGLRSGRVFFGDLTAFDGTLSLETARGWHMGQIVLSDRREAQLEVSVEGLSATDRVILVESGELARVRDADGASFHSKERLELPGRGGFARVECFARDGRALVFSNPIHFVREVPAGGLDPARGAIDVGGVRSVALGGFHLTDARPVELDGRRGLRLTGRGAGGTLVLESEAEGPRVELKDLTGRLRVDGRRIAIEGLAGEGRVVVWGAR